MMFWMLDRILALRLKPFQHFFRQVFFFFFCSFSIYFSTKSCVHDTLLGLKVDMAFGSVKGSGCISKEGQKSELELWYRVVKGLRWGGGEFAMKRTGSTSTRSGWEKSQQLLLGKILVVVVVRRVFQTEGIKCRPPSSGVSQVVQW